MLRSLSLMSDARVQEATAAPSILATIVAAAVAVGLVRVATRMFGLVVLGGVVLATVVALAVGILVLRITLG